MIQYIQPGGAADSVHDMTIAYHKKPVLWDVDLDVPEGVLVGIVGPNGAGKSTMIKAVMDLIPKASGWVKIYDRPYDQMRSAIGYVPQRESVDWDFPVNALDVVLMGRYGHVDGSAGRAAKIVALPQRRWKKWAWPSLPNGRLANCRVDSSSAYFWHARLPKTRAFT